jgi:hypothetical protein
MRALPGLVYERDSSHQPHDDLVFENKSSPCVIKAATSPLVYGRERGASEVIREAPTPSLRTKTLKSHEDKGEVRFTFSVQRSRALSKNMSQDSSASLLGKRIAIKRSDGGE